MGVLGFLSRQHHGGAADPPLLPPPAHTRARGVALFLQQLIYGVSIALENNLQASDDSLQSVTSPLPDVVNGIPSCSASTFMRSGCITFLWAPAPTNDAVGTAVAANVVANILASNSPRIDPASVLSFPNVTVANAWMQGGYGYSPHFQQVLGVYEFFANSGASPAVDFGLQVNATTKLLRGAVQNDQHVVLLPMQQAAEREIARYLAATVGSGGTFGDPVTPAQAAAAIPVWQPELVRFAHPPATSFSYVGVVSPTFLLAAAMFTFTVQIFNVVLERETKLRSAMRVMGVSDGVWWTSWALWDVCVVDVLSALLICAFGAAFQFDLFLHNQFSVLFLHFWLFECSLTGLGYFLSTFVGKSNNATIAGFTIFLFGFIFQLVVTVSSVPFVPAYGGAWFGSVSGHGEYRWIQVIFSIFSPTVFAKGILDLGTASATPGQQSGIKWRTRDSYCYCDPSDPPVSAAGALASLGYAPPPAPPAPLGTPAAPTGAGLAGAPPAPPDFSYLFNNRKVYRDEHLCGASDYRDFALMYPSGGCDYSINECWQWMVLDFFLFYTAALVFDRLRANEYGVVAYSFWSPYDWAASLAFFAAVAVVVAVGTEPGGKSNQTAVAVGFILIAAKVALYVLPRTARGLAALCTGGSFADGFRAAATLAGAEAAAAAAGAALPAGLDDDVAAEEAAIKGALADAGGGLRGPAPPGVAIEVRGLVRSFGTFHAVRGNFFRVETGKLFALLGPNGAGKTTTINLLTGVLPISAGDAVVCGHSVAGYGMPAIRSLMGVCPQFDVLWGELTGREHLRLFAALKGLPRGRWRPTTDELLARTHLGAAADRRSSGYSGGMKRRLSVAVALIGDPEVLYLDEPTTGMDPITRRYVWDVILEAKQGRAVVLTTHSMEEADVLADAITIIAQGRLRCLGSALHLKNKFGAGYRVAVSCATAAGTSAASSLNLAGLAGAGAAGASRADARADATQRGISVADRRTAAVVEHFGAALGVAPSEVGRTYTTFAVPRAAEPRLAGFLKDLEGKRRELGITDVQMSLTTLEQVFLTIAREAEKQSAAAARRTITLALPMGTGRPAATVTLGWGEEEATYAETGEPVGVTWVQNDEGRLQYAHHTWRGETVCEEVTPRTRCAGCGCCGCCCGGGRR